MMTKFFVWWFKWKGWKVNNGVPVGIQQAVAIAAPHTSNWDFIYTLAACKIMGIPLRYLAKKELFFWPLRILLNATGAIPVQRSSASNLVTDMATLFQKNQQLILLIPAEGTRGKVSYWKSGFYHTAIQANVPVLLGYLDYAKKEAGFGGGEKMTGDVDADLKKISSFYADKTGKHPELFDLASIRFKQKS
ncbi:MAG: 1-acyl-sn-glycerol-3-phosphate acyltransferase [Hydrotalea sp.]|nr:1-acyl-sn-glycerol-3-phosphate acyltransferase [Hydrotalea sp.]